MSGHKDQMLTNIPPAHKPYSSANIFCMYFTFADFASAYTLQSPDFRHHVVITVAIRNVNKSANWHQSL